MDKIKYFLIVLMFVSLLSCGKRTVYRFDCPNPPQINAEIANELEVYCPEDKCPNLDDFFKEYYIYYKKVEYINKYNKKEDDDKFLWIF